jgi:hypothetical protein
MIYVPYLARASTDPDWDKVVLLLHGDGSNGGTIIDSSGSNHTITATGTPAINTSNVKFGTGALLFDGTAGYLSAGTSADWQLAGGDFTIEFWHGYYTWNGVAFEEPLIAAWSTLTGQGLLWLCSVDINNRLTFYHSIAGIPLFGAKTTNSTNGIGTSYRHVAITRESNTLRIFFDGVVEYSGAIIGDIDSAIGTELTIGGVNYTSEKAYNGRLDDIRITKGKARYTAAFTPPTAPFPDG